MFKGIIISFCALLWGSIFAFAMQGDTYLIDTPTAEVLPLRDLGIKSRFFSGGGILTYFDFTVVNRLSIGASFTFEHLIGENDQKIKALVPALQLKYRIYDGSAYVPAFALGFDNQGFGYDHNAKEYIHKAKGAYMVATKEIFLPGLVFNPGINITVDNFEFDKLAGFTALAYNIKDTVNVMFEWDNIHSIKTSRLNSGVRVYITENFALDFALRNFNEKTERIAQLKYSCGL